MADREAESDEAVTSFENKEWEINAGDEIVIIDDKVSVIHEKYGCNTHTFTLGA